jgi:Raf kinase inhibitor-like YbhB/YbcL family protein
MKKYLFVVIILFIIIGGGWLVKRSKKVPVNNQPAQITPKKEIKNMKISSPAFKNNEDLPSKYTCDGENVNPSLEFGEIPEGAKSLALIVDDPDATNGDWTHWLLWNMSQQRLSIAENSAPKEATQGITDFGNRGYGGPCPPSGKHRYFFKLFALDEELKISSFSTKKDLLEAMNSHIIGQAEMVGMYEKNK